jgi:aspartyl-tRNA(Asn)/glutamyl-tRNA(Gln) amidotransferase subunit B
MASLKSPTGERKSGAAHPYGEDAGKSLHEGFPDSNRNTYLDFNRSGVPLVESLIRI